jgi:RNA-dependent RNA polymerase
MNIGFKFAPNDRNKWNMTRTFAGILHSDNFALRNEDEGLTNFQVKLNINPAGGVRSNGTGTLIVPTKKIGNKLLEHLRHNPLKIDKKKLRFFRDGGPPKRLALTLEKTPYANPDLEEEREEKLLALEGRLRVGIVQFGIFYQPKYPSKDDEPLRPRAFSIEWEGDYVKHSSGWLTFDSEYDHKLIRITVSLDPQFIVSA